MTVVLGPADVTEGSADQFAGGPAAFADVFVLDGREGLEAGPAIAGLQARYPGLTLVVVLTAGSLVAGFRDGTRLTVWRTVDHPWTPSGAAIAARQLYHVWIAAAAADLPHHRAASSRAAR